MQQAPQRISTLWFSSFLAAFNALVAGVACQPKESPMPSLNLLPGKRAVVSFLVLFALCFFQPVFAAPPGCPGETDLHLSGISFSGDSLCAARGELKVTASEAPTGARAVLVAGQISLGADFAVGSGGVLQATTMQIQLPIARAGDDQGVASQSMVTMDGSASEAPGGHIESYQWHQLSGSPILLQTPDQAIATFAAPAVSVNTALGFELEITDQYGFTAGDQIVITVAPSDRDSDGIPDDHDAFPDDPNEAYDFDGDGMGDNADTDRDGDGVVNDSDFYPDDPANKGLHQTLKSFTAFRYASIRYVLAAGEPTR